MALIVLAITYQLGKVYSYNRDVNSETARRNQVASNLVIAIRRQEDAVDKYLRTGAPYCIKEYNLASLAEDTSMELLRHTSAEGERASLSKIQTLLQQKMANDQAAFASADGGDKEVAAERYRAINNRLFNEFAAALRSLNLEFDHRAYLAAKKVDKLTHQLMYDSWIMLGIALLLAVGFIVATTRTMIYPIKGIASVAESMAQGDYGKAISLEQFSGKTTDNKETPAKNELRQIAVALGSMARNLERRERTLAAHADIGSICVSAPEMDELLERTTATLAKYARAYVAVMYLPGEDGLVPKALHGISDEDASRAFHGFRQLMEPVITCGKTVVVHDTDDIPQYDFLASTETTEPKSVAFIPVSLVNSERGVVLFATSQEFDQYSLTSLEIGVAQIGMAIQRAQSYSRVIQAEEQASFDRECLLAIIETMPECVIILSAPEGSVYMANKAAKDLCGLNGSADGLFINHIKQFEMLDADGNTLLPENMPLMRALIIGETCVREELMMRGNGRDLFLLCNSVPIKDDDGNITGALSVFQDISLIKQHQQILELDYKHQCNISETLQKSFLPTKMPFIPGYEIADIYIPAQAGSQLGGDFYDVIELGNGDLGVVIGDVSGKGVEAAVHTAMAKYMLRGFVHENPDPASVLTRLNNAITRYVHGDLFITLLYGRLFASEKKFVYANGGHEHPLLVNHQIGKYMTLDSTGAALGVVSESVYTQNEISLSENDLLIMYTDGVTDSRQSGKFLGVEGLQKMVQSVGSTSACELAESVIAELKDYTGCKLRDDVAMLVIKVTR